MAYVAPTPRADGYTVDADEWNKNTVDNPIALKALIDTNTTAIAGLGLSKGTVCGRLTLTSGTPVTTSDVTAATTLYYALYSGNQIALYTGSAWVFSTIAELSIAVPATTSQMYDVFVDYNGGTPALSLTAWTNDTTRATALTKQDGVLVLSGSTGKRYIGSFRTTGVSGQTEDSEAKRYVWNYYNRVPGGMRRLETTASWPYSTASYQQANNAAANQLDFVIGVAEDAVEVEVIGYASNDTVGCSPIVGIGIDSTTVSATGVVGGYGKASALALIAPTRATLRTVPAAGRHTAVWLEYDNSGSGVTTWSGKAGGGILQSGITGMTRR